jgi:hypothetical protein
VQRLQMCKINLQRKEGPYVGALFIPTLSGRLDDDPAD